MTPDKRPDTGKRMSAQTSAQLRRLGVRIDKPHPGPESLGDILAQLFVARGWGSRTERSALERAVSDAVRQVAGPALCSLVTPGKLTKGSLEVWVRGSAALAEFSGFHKAPLLAALRQAHPTPEIQRLRFRNLADAPPPRAASGKGAAGKKPAASQESGPVADGKPKTGKKATSEDKPKTAWLSQRGVNHTSEGKNP